MCIAQNIISLRSVGNCFAISSSATFESVSHYCPKSEIVAEITAEIAAEIAAKIVAEIAAEISDPLLP
jgi:hypothetical protein